MPRLAALHRQEAILRLRRRERPPTRNRHAPRTYKGISDEDVARIDSAVSEGVAKGQPPHIRVRRIAEGHLLREDRQAPRLRRLPKRQGPPASEMRQVQPQIRLFREEDGDVRQESRSQGHQAS